MTINCSVAWKDLISAAKRRENPIRYIFNSLMKDGEEEDWRWWWRTRTHYATHTRPCMKTHVHTHTHSHMHARKRSHTTPTQHARIHVHTRTHIHTHAQTAHAHTHTHTQYGVFGIEFRNYKLQKIGNIFVQSPNFWQQGSPSVSKVKFTWIAIRANNHCEVLKRWRNKKKYTDNKGRPHICADDKGVFTINKELSRKLRSKYRTASSPKNRGKISISSRPLLKILNYS